MLKKFKAWFKRHIDYRIVKTYLELDKNGHYVTKHVRKYYFKK